MPSLDRPTTYARMAALLVYASASCDSKEPPRPTAAPSSTVTAAPSATAAAPLKTAATPSKHADAKGPRAALPFTDEQKKRQPSYAESLAKGRKATSLHKYDDAIAAFDVAVSLAPDGRALSERGYARFLAKSYDLALKDFDAASDIPTDEVLFGQVWFNKGLTYQALGRGKDAELAFYRSNRGHPTNAAVQRLAGKSACPVKVDRSRVAAHAYAGWAAWAFEMNGLAYVPGESEAKAAERLCPGCTGDLAEKLARFSDHWSPKVVGELNGQHVKLVKFAGPFTWHHHEAEDELFLVVKGRFRMEFRDRAVWLEEGELIVVPRGTEHRPVADEEVHVLLFEPATTLNTGNVTNERTVAALDRI